MEDDENDRSLSFFFVFSIKWVSSFLRGRKILHHPKSLIIDEGLFVLQGGKMKYPNSKREIISEN